MLNQLTQQEITNDELHSISVMAHNQVRLEQEIMNLQETLSQKSDQLRNLAEVLIPEAMMAIGLSELKLSGGESLSIKKFYSASISPENLSGALNWLRTTGNDDIIKNNVICQFGKGEDDTAQLAVELLRSKGLQPEQKTFVHPMTLKAFVKERIENAQDLPQELFGVFVGQKTKITPAK